MIIPLAILLLVTVMTIPVIREEIRHRKVMRLLNESRELLQQAKECTAQGNDVTADLLSCQALERMNEAQRYMV